MRNPIINIEVALLHETADDAGNAKVVALVQLHVHQVVVARQDVPGVAVFEEVDAVYVFILEENVLLFELDERTQERTDPSNEGDRPFSEEKYLFKRLLKDEQADLDPQILR